MSALEKDHYIVKIGTNAITRPIGTNGESFDVLDRNRMQDIALNVVDVMRNETRQLILPSSGAVAAGREYLGQHQAGKTRREKQFLAAAGQPHLSEAWREAFGAFQDTRRVVQVLLNPKLYNDDETFRTVQADIQQAEQFGTVIVANENDSEADEEFESDNDGLAFQFVRLVHGMNPERIKKLILLTEFNGVFDRHPEKVGAKHIPEIRADKIDDAFMAQPMFHDHSPDSSRQKNGMGGIPSKLKYGKKAAELGVETVIAAANEPNIVARIIEDDETVGTRIYS